jgi:protein-S-isoprenylcysteine O-methyltransferase Ste14
MNAFFHYSQLALLVLFTCFFVVRIVYLRAKEGVSAVSLKLKDNRLRGILTVSLVTCINSWVAVTLVYLLRPEIQLLPAILNIVLVDSLAVKITGFCLMVLALVLYVLALFTLGSSWRVGAQEAKVGGLVTHGIYAVSRNPIYVFFALYFIGTFLINGALVFLIFAIAAILNLHYLTLAEERSLLMSYGDAFRDYCALAPRYFDWRKIWPVKLYGGSD